MSKEKKPCTDRQAFTFVELLSVLAAVAMCAVMVLPAMARTRTNTGTTQCLNNLKRLATAWTMYPTDNRGALIASYPDIGGFTGSWCKGNASTSGGAGSSVYSGADPAGITTGLLYPYIKMLSPYKCPFDRRVAPVGTPFPGKPILRSVSMNCYMAGRAFPGTYSVVTGGTQDPNAPVFLKENEIPRPSKMFVILDEDPQSINDGMIIVDMAQGRLVDLPSRLHGFGINFADTHAEIRQLRDAASISWTIGQNGGINDWRALTNITTAPVN